MNDRETIKEIVREALREQLALAQLANLTGKTETQTPTVYVTPWTGVSYEAHPSQQKLNVSEAALMLSDLLEFAETKACTVEQNKPCDQCGMCRSLGF